MELKNTVLAGVRPQDTVTPNQTRLGGPSWAAEERQGERPPVLPQPPRRESVPSGVVQVHDTSYQGRPAVPAGERKPVGRFSPSPLAAVLTPAAPARREEAPGRPRPVRRRRTLALTVDLAATGAVVVLLAAVVLRFFAG